MGSVCGQTAREALRCWHHVASPAPSQPQGSPGPLSTWPCVALCALRSSCPKQLAARHRASTPQWAPPPPRLRAQPVLLPGVVPGVRYLGSRKTAGQTDGLIKKEPADVNRPCSSLGGPLTAHFPKSGLGSCAEVDISVSTKCFGFLRGSLLPGSLP